MLSAIADSSLPKEIADFGALVGLLLALVTLLTANRAAALDGLYGAAEVTASQRRREIALDLVLAVVTTLVWLSGLPLAVRSIKHLHPLGHGGPLQAVFALTWLLLLGLVVWQSSLIKRGFDLETSQ